MKNAVKPVYSDHSWDQVIGVSADRWSLYRGAIVQLKLTVSQPTVVSIDMWSLYGIGLFVKTSFTVSCKQCSFWNV